MLLSELIKNLKTVSEINFLKPDGTEVPKHFHITEIGQISKKYIDCGGTVRNENKVSLQLWESIDVWHRLTPEKLLQIIYLSIEKLNVEDHEIEVEFQSDTIGKYRLEFKDSKFILINTNTNCLAEDKCEIPSIKKKIKISEIVSNSCVPGSGCC